MQNISIIVIFSIILISCSSTEVIEENWSHIETIKGKGRIKHYFLKDCKHKNHDHKKSDLDTSKDYQYKIGKWTYWYPSGDLFAKVRYKTKKIENLSRCASRVKVGVLNKSIIVFDSTNTKIENDYLYRIHYFNTVYTNE